MNRWVTIVAERVLRVARGRDIILCDDHLNGPVTLIVKVENGMQNEVDVIADIIIRRDSEDGEISCGHRLGEQDAKTIINALEVAGYRITPTEAARSPEDRVTPRD